MVAHVGVGVDADGGDVQLTAGGALVQCLDVLENMLEAEALRGDEFLRQSVEHEGVVGIGRMAESERAQNHEPRLGRAGAGCHGKAGRMTNGQ